MQEASEVSSSEYDSKAAMESCFGRGSVEEIYGAVQAQGSEWGNSTIAALQKCGLPPISFLPRCLRVMLSASIDCS